MHEAVLLVHYKSKERVPAWSTAVCLSIWFTVCTFPPYCSGAAVLGVANSEGNCVWLSVPLHQQCKLSMCRPTFQQLVEVLTEIEVEFRRECHRQRPAMAVGVATNSPSPGRRRSVGFGGVPLPHGARKPPTRFGSGLDLDAASFSALSATPMLRAASSAQSEAFTKATAMPSSRQS